MMITSLLMISLVFGPYLCDGQWHLSEPWNSPARYHVMKVSPRMGVDLYSTQDFVTVVYWIHGGRFVEVGILQGDRGGVNGLSTDRMTDSVDGFVLEPGDQLVLGTFCAAYAPNLVFGLSSSQTHGHGWAYIWVTPIP